MVECDNVSGRAFGVHDQHRAVVASDDSDEGVGGNVMPLAKGLDKFLVVDHICHHLGDFANFHGIMESDHHQAVYEGHNFESSASAVGALGVHTGSPFKFNIYLN